MKKIVVRIIIVVISGILIVIISSVGWLFYNMKKDAPKRTMEELKTCFTQNQYKFENAATVIGKYPSLISIDKEAFMVKNDNMFYYETEDKLYIKSKSKLPDDSIQEIGSSITYILNTLNFEKVSVQDGDFYFIEGSDIGIASGLVYVTIGEKPGDMYITKLDKIYNKWFSFKAR